MNFLKSPPVRSLSLLEACRLIPCQVIGCGADDGTVCAMHSNWHEHGKAGARKADDNRVASGCMRCHSALDQGSTLTYEQRKAMWWGAHVRTVQKLVSKGLWPAGVPIPDTTPPDDLPAHVPLTTTTTWEGPFQ